jgi:hypothetical protein
MEDYAASENLRSPPAQRSSRIDLISDALPFGRLWYGEPNAASNAIGYAKHRSRSHRTVMLFLRLGTLLRLSTLLRLDTVLRLSSVLRLAAA